MKAVLDACVIYPSVLREILIGAAAAGLYQPLWSERILGEWVRAVAKLGPLAVAQATGEAAMMRAAFPASMIREQPGIAARLHLPDPDDVHVLAVAIAGNADAIVTFNAMDFPRHILAEEGIARRDPDGFLWELQSHHPSAMAAITAEVQAKAAQIAGTPVALTSLLKRAKLPRLAKAVQAT
jgi:predicted nucleic acid-binding protein